MGAVVKVDASGMMTTSNEIRLGTAAWEQPGGRVLREFRDGDFFLGMLGSGSPLGFSDDRHVLLTCGTRGGKGVSVIIPNVLMWKGSSVVIDPKGEIATVAARRRGRGSEYSRGMNQKTRILDPFGVVGRKGDEFRDLKGCYNPMSLLRKGREESVDDASRIAEGMIVAENSADRFWEESARDQVRSIMLHVATWRGYEPEERNLVTVRRAIMSGDWKARELALKNATGDKKKKVPSGYYLLAAAMTRNHAFGGLIADAGTRLMDLERNSPRVLASIMQVAATNTAFIDSPGMRRVLSKSHFELSELKTSKEGTNLFLCLPQRHMETHYRWLRLMTSLLVAEMERLKQRPASGHSVLMVLDEFPALRRMTVIENAAAQIAGYGVKMVFAVQTLAQLKDIYKDNWETLVANAGVKMFFCNDDHFTREYASRLIGDTEVVRTVQSRSATLGGSESVSETQSRSSSSSHSSSETAGASWSSSDKGWSASYNRGVSESRSLSHSSSGDTSLSYASSYSNTDGISQTLQKRPLVTPDEVGRFFGNRDEPKALVLVSGFQPLAIDRASYYRNQPFEGYFDPHVDHKPPLTLAQLKAKHALAEQERLRQIAWERKEIAERIRQAELAAMEAAMAAHRQAIIDAEVAEARRRQEEIRYYEQRWQRRWKALVWFLREDLILYVIWGLMGVLAAVAGAAFAYVMPWIIRFLR